MDASTSGLDTPEVTATRPSAQRDAGLPSATRVAEAADGGWMPPRLVDGIDGHKPLMEDLGEVGLELFLLDGVGGTLETADINILNVVLLDNCKGGRPIGSGI